MEATCSSLIFGDDHLLASTVSLIKYLGVHEQRTFLHSILRILSKEHLGDTRGGIHDENLQDCSRALGGAAALISELVKDTTALKDELVDWLTGVSGDDIGLEINVRRVVVSVLVNDHGKSLVRTNGLPAYRL